MPGWGTSAVVIVRDHPPPMAPRSPLASSKANRFQVPLGLVPLKTVRAVAVEGAGAGAGQTSPGSRFVGRNVPVPTTPAAGIVAGAASSNVSVPLTPNPPPFAGSDMSTMFCPAGPASSTSMSAAMAWVTELRVTFTSLTVPAMPETAIGGGVRGAGPPLIGRPGGGDLDGRRVGEGGHVGAGRSRGDGQHDDRGHQGGDGRDRCRAAPHAACVERDALPAGSCRCPLCAADTLLGVREDFHDSWWETSP